MAQSRMAGMAMDLGPSDLADVGEAATLATNKMGMEQGRQASIHYDVGSGRSVFKNDGDAHTYVRNSKEKNGPIYQINADTLKSWMPNGQGYGENQLRENLAFPLGRSAPYGSRQSNGPEALGNASHNMYGEMYYGNRYGQ